MADDQERFESLLREGASHLGLRLPEEGVLRLLAHRRILLRWAPKLNLTTVLDPEGMAERLYLDSAMPLPYLQEKGSLHDIGSGAGFPGMVLKAIMPAIPVTLTEARHRKVAFLRQAAWELGLKEGMTICCSRLGTDRQKEGVTWSEVVSRATFPPLEWIRAGSDLVSPGGRLWIFSGQPHGDENELTECLPDVLGELPANFSLETDHPYQLPFSGRKRRLVSLRRKDQ